MAEAMKFCPSDIHSQTLFISSRFQDSEKEAVSAFVSTFLAARGNDWNSEFAWLDFGDWITSDNAHVNEHYRIISQFRGGQDIINAIHDLIEDGYMERHDKANATYLRLTERYVEFFRQYADASGELFRSI